MRQPGKVSNSGQICSTPKKPAVWFSLNDLPIVFIGLQSNDTDLAKKVVKLYELNTFLTQRVVETANHLKGNCSKLAVSQTLLEGEFSQLSSTYNNLQVNITEQTKYMKAMENGLQTVNQETTKTK